MIAAFYISGAFALAAFIDKILEYYENKKGENK